MRLSPSLLLLAAACASRTPLATDLPVCVDPLAAPLADAPGSFPHAAWLRLLVRQEPLRDCRGRTIATASLPNCPRPTDTSPVPTDLSPDDLVVAEADEHHTLAWLITARFADGDGLGPAALVEWRHDGPAVRALGTVRAPASGAALHLWSVGDRQVFVVEGERCPASGPCTTELVLAPRRGPDLLALPVFGPGGCVGPARFPRSRTLHLDPEHEVRGADDLRATTDGVAIDETLTWARRGPTPAPPTRVLTRTRRLRLADDRLLVDLPSLWSALPRESLAPPEPTP